MRVRHLWYHAGKRRTARDGRALIVAQACDPQRTVGMLSPKAQGSLGWFSRWIAFFTTPFKFLGISGWTDTGCSAEATGSPVRDAQHSTDGFWTIDVELHSFEIGSAGGAAGRFIRIEVEPDTKAHAVCSQNQVRAGEPLSFGGPVVVDTDGPFLEVHPDGDFEVAARREVASAHQAGI